MQLDFYNLKTGDDVMVGGFASTIRDHGGLIFIDLRSEDQILQCVIDPETNPEAFKLSESVHSEYVLKISGKIQDRTEETINPNLPTGSIELVISTLEIVSKAKTMPFDIQAENKNMAGEETRLKYRYLDFRRSKLKKMIKLRSKFILAIRNWFADRDFVDVHTPILANSSPEGARDYLIPSRLHPGKFYALPQAPQQFKQLLMVGGFNKYIQIAPCFRDEDPRADRAIGDFYQVDGEVAWGDEDQIYELSNSLVKEVFAKFTDKKLMHENMPKITHTEAMNKYGSDRPDLRYELPWQDAKDIFRNSDFAVFANLCDNPKAKIQALHIKDAVTKFSRSDLDKVQDIGRQFGLPGIAYIQYFEDGAKSPIFKFLGEEKTKELQNFFDAKTGDLILFIANENSSIVYKAQDQMRQHIARKLNLIDENLLCYVWIDGFPFFEKDDKTGVIDFAHNPFSSWQGGLDALLEAQKNGTILDLHARQYDIAVNGYEVLSGGVRNTNPEALLKAFEVIGYTEEEVRTKFGHMLEAYEYGSPTHAGFAWGVPRNLMVLTGETNIREVIPFPKNGSGVDPMTGSPSSVSQKQLTELNLKITD
jgi:aspartyl-tRNA synthetase